MTQLSYQIDNGAPTNVDVTDSANVHWSNLVATAGLTDGLHRLRVNVTDDLGRTGLLTDGFFVVSNTAGNGPRLVTQMEYRIDGGAFVPVDNVDQGIVNFNQIIATNSLAIGLHSFDLRSTDDLGRVGQVHRAFLIASSPIVAGQLRTIVGAEYFVNVDPGEGNAVAIPLPNDSTWDQGQEQTTALLTGLPVGMHLVGMRVQNDLGQWSKAVEDTILVGPILVIHLSGSNMVLDWQSGSGVNQFKIYRASTANGSYALLDSTAAQTYTDVNAVNLFNQKFYQVTFETNAFSSFRLPDRVRSTEQ